MVVAVNTLIIGGGQAGLALSYCLTQHQHPHLILERAPQLADAWRNHRWNSFTLVTPNWQTRLPGAAYQGDDPGGFWSRDQVAAYLEQYAASFNAPLHFNVRAVAVEPSAVGYLVRTSAGDYTATNVVVATGLFQQPRIPAFSANLPGAIRQLHSGQYRDAALLPPGAVLVVGSAQSGCQIAEELPQAGRKVYLCGGGSSGRAPRRYRGQDIMSWLAQIGFFARTVDNLPSPRAKFGGNPHVSGKDGGHSLNLHKFAHDGVTLLGRIVDIQGSTIRLAPDLHGTLAAADKFEADLLARIDQYIDAHALAAPAEQPATWRDGYAAAAFAELDLAAAGVTCVIWAIGYTFDFTWVDLPVLDGDGFPVQQRGVTAFQGLYFLGLPWLHTITSGLLYGVGDDAAHIAGHILGHGTAQEPA